MPCDFHVVVCTVVGSNIHWCNAQLSKRTSEFGKPSKRHKMTASSPHHAATPRGTSHGHSLLLGILIVDPDQWPENFSKRLCVAKNEAAERA